MDDDKQYKRQRRAENIALVMMAVGSLLCLITLLIWYMIRYYAV